MKERFKFRVWNDMQKCYSQDDHYIDEDGQLNTSGKYIVEQCTGLKDKNGKLIYEGDIVYSPFDNGTKKVIFWDNYLARFMAYNRYPDKRFYQGISSKYFIELEFEVIGNIHENADLLENKQ